MAMVPQKVLNGTRTRAGALICIRDARLEVPGKVDPLKVGGKMLILSSTSSYQTGAKYLKTGKQIPVARRL